MNRKFAALAALALVSAFAQTDIEIKQAQHHYNVALEALADHNLGIAAEELNKAVSLAPANALVQYYLAQVQSQQNVPASALEHLKRAISLGLPAKEADAAEQLLAKLEYRVRKDEADAVRVTPQKLVGLYEGEYKGVDDDPTPKWKPDNDDSGWESRDAWNTQGRTLSLNIVNGTHITGFIRVDIRYVHEGREINNKMSNSERAAHEIYEKARTGSDGITRRREDQARYFFVDLAVTPDGKIEGTQRQVCYQYGGGYNTDSSTSLSVNVNWSQNGTLTFRFADGGSREYKKTGSVAGSVGTDVAYRALVLRPFLQ